MIELPLDVVEYLIKVSAPRPSVMNRGRKDFLLPLCKVAPLESLVRLKLLSMAGDFLPGSRLYTPTVLPSLQTPTSTSTNTIPVSLSSTAPLTGQPIYAISSSIHGTTPFHYSSPPRN